jgi:hypothetical protein
MSILLAILLAAPGDLGYAAETKVEVSPTNAVNLAQAFKDVNAWSGTKANVIRCAAQSQGDGFIAWCIGDKTADPSALPLSVRTKGKDGGNLIYETKEQVTITTNEARAFADNFKALGGWTGLRQHMGSCCIQQSGSSSTGYEAVCKGKVFVDPGALPGGAMVIDRE